MFIYCDLAALVLVLTFYRQAHAGKIIGGHEAAPHSRPYMALLTCRADNGSETYCGGVLVSEYFVITAAHCKAKSYELSTKAIFDKNVQPIVLADMCDNKLPKKCVVSGWGATSDDNKNMSNELREVNVTLTHGDFCTEKNEYCSKGEDGPAEGDSGGPLVCEDGKAFGVISAKSLTFKLTKYAKIPYYREWIDEIMKHN
ncbi:granzyme E-like isoform X2 [Xiphophorus couchianus]|uniref:granzyme E-like isoform X2 n=1 Tax=Xiphophorus couchianus TaxID=32473 RepID=UPI0010170C07|nr:granzyme E-like isoform X2 [Xiphophorus couchianus]